MDKIKKYIVFVYLKVANLKKLVKNYYRYYITLDICSKYNIENLENVKIIMVIKL